MCTKQDIVKSELETEKKVDKISDWSAGYQEGLIKGRTCKQNEIDYHIQKARKEVLEEVMDKLPEKTQTFVSCQLHINIGSTTSNIPLSNKCQCRWEVSPEEAKGWNDCRKEIRNLIQ